MATCAAGGCYDLAYPVRLAGGRQREILWHSTTGHSQVPPHMSAAGASGTCWHLAISCSFAGTQEEKIFKLLTQLQGVQVCIPHSLMQVLRPQALWVNGLNAPPDRVPRARGGDNAVAPKAGKIQIDAKVVHG